MFWLKSILILFVILFSLPTAVLKISAILNTEDQVSYKILDTATKKVKQIKTESLKGSPRASMWRSSIPWIKDYWLIGSGLDTIKYMYPKYREPKYGIVEGGHNYTPDRLHNEYLNTLATKGVYGFITYYILFIGGAMLIILKGLYRLRESPIFFLGLGTCMGAFIYLGQVMFNFGVVATLVLFYILLALSVCFSQLKDE